MKKPYIFSHFFCQDFMKTVERVGAFFNLYRYYDENGRNLRSGGNRKTKETHLPALLEKQSENLC